MPSLPKCASRAGGFTTNEADAPAPAPDLADPQPLPDEQIARIEGIGLVRLSLNTLDERSREVVRLKFNEDLSYAEISQRMGLKVGHVGYLLHYALKKVATELAKTGVAP
jgi:RNA polymerase sigma factor (sigma-70 family)